MKSMKKCNVLHRLCLYIHVKLLSLLSINLNNRVLAKTCLFQKASPKSITSIPML